MRGPTLSPLIRALRQVLGWLRAPGWQGWSFIVGLFTLGAVISVSVILFLFAQQEEKQREEATRAHFLARVLLFRDKAEDQWSMDMFLGNDGPASSAPLRVDIMLGGQGIEPMPDPTISHGTAEMGWWHRVVDLEGHACFKGSVEIRVTESLLPGDALTVSQVFAVEAERDLELKRHPTLVFGQLGEVGSLREGLILYWESGQSDESLIGAFVRSVTIRGTNVDFFQEWHYDEALCP